LGLLKEEACAAKTSMERTVISAFALEGRVKTKKAK
jgi:hypothetical protein